MKTIIKLRKYQNKACDFLLDNDGKLVLAMCPSSGKTETVIEFLNRFFNQNKKARVLILPHSTNVLLDNFYNRLESRDVDFTYSNSFDESKNVDVILPQSFRHINGDYDLIIVDEAHENYFAKTIQSIIKKSNIKKQILMTGTPSKFIGKKDFKFHFFALNELGAENIPKLKMKVIESDYKWNGNYNANGEVKSSFNYTKKQTSSTISKVFKDVMFEGNNVSKTLIICKSIKQSVHVKNYLDSINIDSETSNSETDLSSSLISDFKDNKFKVLIVVNRARLGYDDCDLVNMIDMSGTLNIDLIYQMYARLLRGGSDDKKVYVRLTSKDDVVLNSEIRISQALQLSKREHLEKYDTDVNKLPILVPKKFSKKDVKNSQKEKKPYLIPETDDIINFFKEIMTKEDGYKVVELHRVLNTFKEDDELELYKTIAHCYNEGMSKQSTAIKLNKEGFTVSSIAKVLDMPRSTVSGYVNHKTKYIQNIKDYLNELNKTHFTSKDLQILLKISKSNVNRNLDIMLVHGLIMREGDRNKGFLYKLK